MEEMYVYIGGFLRL